MVVAKKVSKETPINTIWDDGKYYILEHIPTGEKAYFDRTDKALRTVRRKIKQSGSVGFKKDTGQFAFLSKKAIQLICLKCCTQRIAVNRCHGYEMDVHVRKMEIIII